MPFNIALNIHGVHHGFGFSTRDPNFPLDSVCINHLPQLNKFCEYFMEETAEIERELLGEKFNIGNLLGSHFHKPIPFLSGARVSLKGFYKKLKGAIPEETTLSPREKQCLHHFLSGDSCREIGEKLGLKTRTIEAYFVTIKTKLNCPTKSELFKCAQELVQFGLLRMP
jgi:DNA-binding CsgD family transcriptional regulator